MIYVIYVYVIYCVCYMLYIVYAYAICYIRICYIRICYIRIRYMLYTVHVTESVISSAAFSSLDSVFQNILQLISLLMTVYSLQTGFGQ